MHAVDDFKEDLKGFKQLLDEGWVTREQHDELVEETEEHHKKVVQVELSKKRSEKKEKRKKSSWTPEKIARVQARIRKKRLGEKKTKEG